MANLTELLAALSNLPQIQGGPPLTPNPAGMGDFKPPQAMQFPQPEPPPPAPSMPLNLDIIRQAIGLAGPPPTPPGPPAPIGTLGRIALALQGFGAGVQGVGPQFLAQLQEQREAPQRAYQQQLGQYNQERARFAMAGLEAAQRAEQTRQAQQTDAANRRFELDVQNRARQ